MWLNLGLILVILLSLIIPFRRYLYFDFNHQLGYLDPHLYWQSLSDFAAKKVIYRDFYWEYGLLYLAIGLPFFIIWGKTFLASIIISNLFIPLISVLLSLLVGKALLKKKPLILFIFLLFLYGINNDFTSIRHLLPELGLVISLIGFESNNRRKILLGGSLIGLSLLSSIEYGIAAIISLVAYFLITLFKKKKSTKFIFAQISYFYAPVALISLPYFFFLKKVGSLRNFITFTFQYAKSFYFSSPCREFFPRLGEANFWQRINLYFVPLTLLGLLGVTIAQRKSKWFSTIITLLVYSFLLFYRVLNTPCLNYLNYGLTFLFLTLTFILFLPQKSFYLKTSILIIIFWFTISASPNNLVKILSKSPQRPEVSEAEFLPVAGVKLKKRLSEEYKEIVGFIKNNTKQTDTIYVYPNGPYNQLTHIERPVSIAATWYYDLVPNLVNITYRQLKANPPRLVIINIFNASSVKSALNRVPYNIHLENKNVIFEGILTPVEQFISQNYELDKKFNLAWVLKKRKEPLQEKDLYLPIGKRVEWKMVTRDLSQYPNFNLNNITNFNVEQSSPRIQFYSKTLNEADLIIIPIKIDLGIIKVFSKFTANIYAVTGEKKLYLLSKQPISSDWQKMFIIFSKRQEISDLDSIMISVSNNRGFIWWGKPKNIKLKTPKVFIRNQDLKIDSSALK